MIDAHQHVWSLDRPECSWPTRDDGPLYRDFTIAELTAVALPLGVTSSILVQSQESDADTNWLLSLAADEPFVAGVVGWADFEAPDAARRVAELSSRPKLVGLRPMAQHSAADWYDRRALDPAFRAMIDHGLALDALVRVQHLPALNRLAVRHPELAIVIDHAAKPAIDSETGFDLWHRTIAPLAACPNVHCKLSGLLSERGSRPAEAVAPYAKAIVDLFGASRILWGSDWPVLEAAGTYASWLDLARDLVDPAAQSAIFESNARSFYRLSHRDPAQ